MADTPHTQRNIDTHRNMHTDTYRQIHISFLHFTLFGSFGIHAKDTKFLNGTHHTHTEI